MKNLIISCLFGKLTVYLEEKGKIEILKNEGRETYYSTVSFNGPNGMKLLPDEIPYSNGNRTIDDISFSFGQPTFPIVSIALSMAKDNIDETSGVYIISESTNAYQFDQYLKDEFKKEVKKDIYRGTIGYAELVHSICCACTFKNVSIQTISPNRMYMTLVDHKKELIIPVTHPGITLQKMINEDGVFDEFHNRFSKYLNLFDDEKNLVVLRGMFLAGYYGYIYENKKEDVVNIYQDRKIVVPFSEIKAFIDEVLIPYYKKMLNKDKVVYSFDIPVFNELFKEYDIDNNRYLYQIAYPLPWSLRFESGHNVFEKMSIKQMTTFKEKVDKLVNDLQTVQDEPDLVKQCKKLRDIFGDSFSIPEAKEVSKTQMNYIPRSTASGFGR